jgi:signal transduction histidine kinase/CheY-like chemotaxis protein
MGKNRTYHLNHELIYYVFGVFFVLMISPLLFLNVQHSATHESKVALQSDLFKGFICSTLVVGVLFTIELTIDALSNRVSLKHIAVRAVICSTLVISSCLHIYFSLGQCDVVASWTIMHMRSIICGVLAVHVILFRHQQHKQYTLFSYATILFWCSGTVLISYHFYSPNMKYIGTGLRIVGVLITFIRAIRHVSIMLEGKLAEDWYNQWQQAAFEILLTFTLFMGSFIVIFYRPDHDTIGTPMILLSINSVVFLTLLSTIMTDEYRYNFNEVNNKLSVKRLFVRHVSHEIRTPLNCCLLGIKYLKSSILTKSSMRDAEVIEILDEVTEGCNTSLEFVNNLLMYEKIDTVELPLYLKREDLGTLCRQVHKSFAFSAREVGIELNLNIHDALKLFAKPKEVAVRSCIRPCSLIDGPKIVIVLRNLMANALKFTPKGGSVTLTVKPVHIDPVKQKNSADRKFDISPPSSLSADTTHFRVILSDTGPGMSQEEQKQLFTRIVQFNPNDNQKGGGSGIGLYLSHHIMKDHKLKIQVYSEGVPGRGTHFFMDFPRYFSDDLGVLKRVDSKRSAIFGNSRIGRLCPSSLLELFVTRRISNYSGNDTSDKESEESDNNEMFSDENINDIGDGSGRISSMDLTSTNSFNTDKTCHPTFSINLQSVQRKSIRSQAKSMEDLKIAVADDSSLNRKMLIRTLKQNRIGASYDDFSDGLDLLRALGVVSDESDPESDEMTRTVMSPQLVNLFDVIILDDHMTHMNGSVAIKILRQCGYEGLVVGLTGSALKEELEAFCFVGVDYALPKPFLIEDFIEIIRRHM